MNNSNQLQNTNNSKIQFRKKKYEPMDEAQFLEESVKFFKNVASKFSKNDYSNAIQRI